MNSPYYQAPDLRFRSPKGVTSIGKPKMEASEGKRYVLRNSCTLYHHYYRIAWVLEQRADDMQYAQGYRFEEVACIREEAEHFKKQAGRLLGISPLAWGELFTGISRTLSLKSQRTA